MQFAVQANALNHLAPVGLQRAAVIVQVHAGDARDDAIGDLRWQSARKIRVLPFHPPAADHIVALVDLVQQQGNVGRVVLQVGVQRHDHVAARQIKASSEGCRLAKIAAKADDFQVRVAFVPRAQLLPARVPAAVVDDDDFIRQSQRR